MSARIQCGGVIGLHLALQREDDAESWIESIPVENRSESLKEWHARLALLDSNWMELKRRINLLGSARNKPEWQYWHAHALWRGGEIESAKSLWRGLATETGYYSFLAADYLDQDYAICPTPLPVTGQSGHPAVQRALILKRLGFDLEATREWIWINQHLSREERILAARLAADADWYHAAIGTLADAGEWGDYQRRFPIAWGRRDYRTCSTTPFGTRVGLRGDSRRKRLPHRRPLRSRGGGPYAGHTQYRFRLGLPGRGALSQCPTVNRWAN